MSSSEAAASGSMEADVVDTKRRSSASDEDNSGSKAELGKEADKHRKSSRRSRSHDKDVERRRERSRSREKEGRSGRDRDGKEREDKERSDRGEREKVERTAKERSERDGYRGDRDRDDRYGGGDRRGSSYRRSRSPRDDGRSRSRYDEDRDRERDSRRRYEEERDRRRGPSPRDYHSRSRSRYDDDRERSSSRPAGAASSSSVVDLLQRVITGGLTSAVTAGLVPAPAPAAPTASRFGPPATLLAAAQPAAYAGYGAAPGAAYAAAAPPLPAAAPGLGQLQYQQPQQSQQPGALPGAYPYAAGAAGGLAPLAQVAAAPTPDPAGVLSSASVQAALERLRAAAGGGLGAGAGAPNPANKVLRELYVGGLPQGVGLSPQQIRDFFNTVMEQAGLVKPGQQPVVSARMSDTGGFAFIELRTPEECDTALNLNGIPLLGATLKIGRPKGYQQALATGQIPMPGGVGAGMGLGAMGFGGGMLGAQQGILGAQGMLGLGGAAAPMGFGAAGMGLGQPMQAAGAPVAAAAPALPAAAAAGAGAPAPAPAVDSRPTDVILVGNLAPFMTEAAVKEIMEPFGPIAAVTMLPPAAGSVAGGALVTYANPALVDTVIAGLHDLPVGDFNLQLTRAPASLVARASGGGGEAAAASPARAAAAAAAASSVLELHNIVVVRDLGSSEEVSEIREDVAEECSKFGRVVEVLIPPLTAAQSAAGQEAASVPVYVLTGSEADAAAVAAGLRGRRFEGRAVGVQFVGPAALQGVRDAIERASGGWASAGGSSAGAAAGAGSGGGRDYEDEEDAGREGGARGSYAGVSVPPPAQQGQGQGERGTAADVHASGAPEDGMMLPPVPSAADLD